MLSARIHQDISLVFARGTALASAAAAAAYKRCCYGNASLALRRYLSSSSSPGSAGSGQQQQQPTKKQQENYQQQLSKSVIFTDRPASPSYANMTAGQKVVEGSKDFAYTLVVLVGALVTGGLFYVLWRELFSSESPTALQAIATERCLADPQVQAALGEPIKVHGEGSSRRSRSRVHSEESLDAETSERVMTLRYHLVGQINRADVYVQGVMNDDKSWRLKLLAVEVQQFPRRLIVLEKPDKPPPPLPPGLSLLKPVNK